MAHCGPFLPPSTSSHLSLPCFPVPNPQDAIPAAAMAHIDANKKQEILEIIVDKTDNLRRHCLEQFLRDPSYAPSGAITAQRDLIESYEALYDQELRHFIQSLELHLSDRSRTCRKGANFRPGTVSILETAFAKSPTLTRTECKLLAKACGISHQQVRTWFQNKRSRYRKGIKKAIKCHSTRTHPRADCLDQIQAQALTADYRHNPSTKEAGRCAVATAAATAVTTATDLQVTPNYDQAIFLQEISAMLNPTPNILPDLDASLNSVVGTGLMTHIVDPLLCEGEWMNNASLESYVTKLPASSRIA